jgi:AcrR family transcriptional regulator
MCHTPLMGKRQEARDRVEAQIVELGRQHLTTDGAAGLSVRAIARDLGMVSSAVYRYVASRDELLTLLLVDAYSDLAESVDTARTGAGGGWRDQITAIAGAARQWAIGQPASWALLYGSPVPGYRAPADRTVGPGTRVVAALFDAIGEGLRSGAIPDAEMTVPQTLSADFDRLREEFGFAGGDAAIVKGFVLWAGLVGAISLEVFGQYGADTLSVPSTVFGLQIQLLMDVLTVDQDSVKQK